MEVIINSLDYLATVGLDVRKALSAQWLGIATWQYLLAFLLVTFTLFARRVASHVLTRYLVPLLDRVGGIYASRVFEVLIKPLTAILGVVGLFLAVRVLLLPIEGSTIPTVISQDFVNQSFEVAIAAIIVWSLTRLVDVFALFLKERAEEKELPVEIPVIPLLRRSLKLFVGITGGLLVIQHTGYPIASILGGLGIGGLAVALAAQDTLANVFGSVIVFTDKPFKVGDWVEIGDVEGFVEAIGFRSTRIRTWPKALVTLPNKVIAGASITNWSAMPVRRVTFTLNVTIDSPPDKLEQLVDGILEILRTHPGVDQQYYLVNFTDFKESSLGIFIYYFTKSTVWKEHLQVKQEVNIAIMKLLDQLGLSLALPSRTVYLSPNGSHQAIPRTAGSFWEESSSQTS